MKIGWIFQWVFMLFGSASLYLGWYWFGFGGLLLSFGMHLITVTYKGFIIKYIEKIVSADPMFGLPGRRKRNIKRKIKRQNGVPH